MSSTNTSFEFTFSVTMLNGTSKPVNILLLPSLDPKDNEVEEFITSLRENEVNKYPFFIYSWD